MPRGQAVSRAGTRRRLGLRGTLPVYLAPRSRSSPPHVRTHPQSRQQGARRIARAPPESLFRMGDRVLADSVRLDTPGAATAAAVSDDGGRLATGGAGSVSLFDAGAVGGAWARAGGFDLAYGATVTQVRWERERGRASESAARADPRRTLSSLFPARLGPPLPRPGPGRRRLGRLGGRVGGGGRGGAEGLAVRRSTRRRDRRRDRARVCARRLRPPPRGRVRRRERARLRRHGADGRMRRQLGGRVGRCARPAARRPAATGDLPRRAPAQ